MSLARNLQYKTAKKLTESYLKLVSATFLSNCYFSPNDSPSKTMKNVFYFI